MFDFLYSLKVNAVMAVFEQIIEMLPTNMVKDFIGRLIAFAEEKVLGTASTVDDERILPILARMKSVIDLEGNGKVLARLVQFMLTELPELLFDQVMDMFFDWIEDAIEESENKIDDLLLPLINVCRTVLGVEDND